jgi:DNA-binding response OmpR family regulator
MKGQLSDYLSSLDADELREIVRQALANKDDKRRPSSTCWNCGANQRADLVLIRGDFEIDHRGQCTYQGRAIRLTKKQRAILHTIAKENGRFVPTDVITERCIETRKGWPAKTLLVHLNNIKKKFRAEGIPYPIESERGSGYRWNHKPSEIVGQIEKED